MNLLNEIKLAFSVNKKIIAIASLIFFISLFLGFILQPYFYDIFNPVIASISNKLKDGTLVFGFKDIFINNIFIVFRCFIFGLIFCFSAILLIYNGFFVGYFLAGGNVFHKFVLLIPHGIFEFISLILATSAGFLLFKFAVKLILSLKNKGFFASYSENFDILKQSLIIFAISCILMIFAAIIEVYFTLPFGRWILSF